MEASWGLALVIILLVGVVMAIFSVFRDIGVYFFRRIRCYLKKGQPMAEKHRSVLRKYSAYYNKLSDHDQRKFQKRVQRFIHSKTFIPRGFKKVTDEMIVLISAAAIQLTFGLPEVYLANFDKILIYSDSYYSGITKRYHVGEVNPKMGIIILSWKNFVDGYADLNDSFNVGIHEMAHAMHFENRIRNNEYDFLDRESLKKLGEITAQELPKLQRGEDHFFRNYAGTNEYEFFAVALEYFFEKPREFRDSMPQLYFTLCRLLNQDPAELYMSI